MRTFAIPAKYAREVEYTLGRLVAACELDEQLRGPDSPFPNGMIDDKHIDPSRTGTIVIIVGDVGNESTVKVFPIDQHTKVA